MAEGADEGARGPGEHGAEIPALLQQQAEPVGQQGAQFGLGAGRRVDAVPATAEIGRHRGVAICSPIAPYDATRRQVRAYAEEAGAIFVLVHVATPLEECERRDRKGLYAKARAGEIPEFTGISSPYEEPEDATVRIDTTGRDVRDCLDEVLAVLPLDLTTPRSTPSSTQDAR